MADADGHDFPGLVDELVPCVATVVDDVVVGFEDAVRKPIVADELPDVFLRVQLGAFGWQRDQGDVGGDLQAAGKMPSGLIEKKAACLLGGIWVAISARWRFIASVSHRGMTSAAPLPSLGQIAPKI